MKCLTRGARFAIAPATDVVEPLAVGTTFNNLQIRNGDVARVRDAALALRLAPFAIARSGEDWTTVCPGGRGFDGGAAAQRLSAQLGTIVFLFAGYDSSLFSYERYDSGEKTDAYVSDPVELDPDADGDAPPRGGDVERLLAVCVPGVTTEALARLLRQRRVQNLSDHELRCRQIAERHQWVEAAKARFEAMKDKVPGLSLEAVLESARQNFVPSVDQEAVLREELAAKLGEYLGIDASAAIMDHAATVEPWVRQSTVEWTHVAE
jgi:hypothetical protein